tara:strand:+ start:281 stop:577 length:297 start_codon:yes stop_codon:yes gene_type:complete
MNYKDLEKRLEYLSCLLADIEDTSLLEESMELNEEEAKDFLLCRIHNFLYEQFKDTEDQLERLDEVFEEQDKEDEIARHAKRKMDKKIETWTMVKDSD